MSKRIAHGAIGRFDVPAKTGRSRSERSQNQIRDLTRRILLVAGDEIAVADGELLKETG